MGALFTIAVGAVLTYAVHFTVVGVNIHIVGIIVMLAGVAALVAIVVRAVGESQRRNRSEDRQERMLRTRGRLFSRANGTDQVYVQNPTQTYASPAPTAGAADPYMVPEQRPNFAPRPTEAYPPVQSDRR